LLCATVTCFVWTLKIKIADKLRGGPRVVAASLGPVRIVSSQFAGTAAHLNSANFKIREIQKAFRTWWS
jgi:hypothetical protein